MIIYVFCFNLSEHTPRWKAVVAVACQHYTTLLRVHSLFVLKRYLKRGQTQMLLPLVSHRTCHFFKKLRGGEMVWKALFFENWLVQEWRKKISQYFFPSFWFIAHECRQCLSIWEILWSNKNKLPNTFLVRFWESLGNTTFPISGPGVQDQLFQPGPFFFWIQNISGFRERPLHSAARAGHLEFVQLLLEYDADIEIQGHSGRSPLHEATNAGQVDVVSLLLKYGADKDKADRDGGFTPLHGAARLGSVEITRLLLDHNVEKDKVSTLFFETSLHVALQFGHLEVAKLLIESRVDMEATTHSGRSPLHVASAIGQLEIVRLLLQAGANKETWWYSTQIPMKKHVFLRIIFLHMLRVSLFLLIMCCIVVDKFRYTPDS